MEQRTVDWDTSRAGKITCSRMKDVMARGKGKVEWCVCDGEKVISAHGGGKTGETKAKKAASGRQSVEQRETSPGEYLKAREDYLGELVVEILTGESMGVPMSAPMQWGTDLEPHARAAYEARYGVVVQETGFVLHPDIPYIGGSPDGLLPKGGIEAKCPYNPINHLRTWIDGMPDEHMPQVQGNIWVNDADWWDFISFDPRMPAHLRLYVQRIWRDESFIQQMRADCESLWSEVEKMLSDLQSVQPKAA